MRSTAPSLCKNAASFLLLAALFVASPASPGPGRLQSAVNPRTSGTPGRRFTRPPGSQEV